MCEELIQVAVRLRPFNQREKDRHAKSIIGMDGKTISIMDPLLSRERKQFSFDYTYWSHDGFIQAPSAIFQGDDISSSYNSQRKLFDDFGRDLLKNAFSGFNCSVFAYGQTGSGKSYSMIGYGVNRGLIPITCDELFDEIENKKDSHTHFEVTLSMMEVYNEQARDLLSKKMPNACLTVRQHPTFGYYYPQDLLAIPVDNYEDVERLLSEGIQNRTIASTNMNRTSSRAHTIVTIHLDQIIQIDDDEIKRMSTMHFIDLAGSETLTNPGISGDRLNERTNINRSLSTFENVISALADRSSGVKQKSFVPYRESTLTKLIQNSLGGNSKTIMLATLSPADVNYHETLNTLVFADRVKSIKNFVSINEVAFDKFILQLKEENQRFKLLIETGNYNLQLDVKPSMSSQEIEVIRQQTEENINGQIENNEKTLQDSKLPWDVKLQHAQLEKIYSLMSFKTSQVDHAYPFLVNLHEDPILSYVIYHYLSTDEITIGSRNCTIYINGLSIFERHAIIRHIDMNKYELSPAEPTARIKVNGYNLNGIAYLQHNDRILFGANHLYVFCNPLVGQESVSDISKIITWEYAQKDIAKAKGLLLADNTMIEQEDLEQKVLNLLPLISEANLISEELNKYRLFEIILIPLSSWEGIPVQGSKLLVRMKNIVTNNVWFWDDVKFLNRIYIIKDHYQKFLDGKEDILYISKEDDPFWDPLEDVLIGTANVFLQSLMYCMDFADEISIFDHKFLEQGCLSVNLSPCLPNGDALTKEKFIDQPDELLNKPYNFKITINHIEINDEHYSKCLRIRYKIYNEFKFTETKIICQHALRARINQSRIKTIPNIDNNWLNFFDNGCIVLQIFALQDEKKSGTDLFKLTTRELKIIEQNRADNTSIHSNYSNISLLNDPKLKLELTLLHRKYTRLEQKQKSIQQLCRKWETNHDHAGLHRSLSAITFSSGTKLKPTNMQNKDNLMEIYLFGKEEQEYLNDIEQNNPDRLKYWNDYYEKLALRQNNTSLSYRVNQKCSPFFSRMNAISFQRPSLTDQLNRTDRLARSSTSKLNQDDDQASNNRTLNPSRLRWKRAIKLNKYQRRNEQNKILLNNETNSTICTIQ
ncbi:unnamed protein product [Rotaria socialis]|uniref:Kinesin motor domain-containing protein n=1 Tax=Rotaria socialis TaxID=392032 RepID=A0A820R631_9BILA|nr:unnamed protein product [Rotaria socialis]